MQRCKDCKRQYDDCDEFCEHCNLFLPNGKRYDKVGIWLVRTLAVGSSAFCIIGWAFNSYLNTSIPSSALWFSAGIFGSITLEFCYSLKSGMTFTQVLDTIATGSSHSLLEVKRTAKVVEHQLEKTHEKTDELGRQLQRLGNVHNVETLNSLIRQNEELLERLREVGEIYNVYIKPRLDSNSTVIQPQPMLPAPAENKSLLDKLSPWINPVSVIGSTFYIKNRFDTLEQKFNHFAEPKSSKNRSDITLAQMTNILKHFDNLNAIKEASVDDIASVEGVSKKLAGQIKKHLGN